MKTWQIKITLKVSDNWIEDGFDFSERIEQTKEFFEQDLLPYANGNEVSADIKIVKAPDKKEILKLQGYNV